MQTSGKGMLRSAVLAALLITLLFSRLALAETVPTLGPGSEKNADLRPLIQLLQEELNAKGYYNVKVITSTYTPGLKNAVGIFQIANNSKLKGYRLGYADEQTQKLAASDDAVLHAEYIEKVKDAQLRLGGSGSYVKTAQSKLKALGYYTGSISGSYGSATAAAVTYFQKANNLAETGNADGATRAVLYSTDPEPVTRARYEEEHNLTPLNTKSQGAQVTQLQTQLAKFGYFGGYWGDPTGVYDSQTRYSVKFFQMANGFSANGNASTAVREKANSDSAVKFEEYTKNMQLTQLWSRSKPGIQIAVLQLKLKELGYYTGIINGIYSTQVVSAVRTFQGFNYPAIKSVTGKADTTTRTLMNDEAKAVMYSAVCGDDTLKPGARGDAVASMQSRLNTLEYYHGSADGIYDGDVTSAVKLFQKYNSLYQSGIAYTQTLNKLNSDDAKSYVNAKIEKLIAVAESKYGDEYTSGKHGPDEFDCSGFTYFCLKQVGVSVSAEVQSQGRMMLKMGKKITNYKELKPGDILYFWSPDHQKKPGHAGIFVEIKKGEYRFIHASSTYDKVTISKLNTDYYLNKDDGAFLYGIRLWE